jgi:protein phosphatase
MSEPRRKRLLFDTAVLTDRGMVRRNNEDSSLALDVSEPNTLGAESYGIYLVADGMGGHQAGEVASEMATQMISATLLDSLRQASESLSPSHLVKQAMERANTEVYNMAGSNPEFSTMGTTVTLGLRLGNELYLGHIGDSRAYLIRKGRIQQLTEDHSLVACLLKAGAITLEEAKMHPDRGKILRCLGVSAGVTIDTYRQTGNQDKLTLHNGDSLVFCTDGLTGYVSDGEILDCLQGGGNAHSICQDLVNLANLRGGEDNISVIVVKVKSGAGKRAFFQRGKAKRNPDRL